MARFEDRKKALELRKKGKSYSQIKKLLKVSKGTLSLWLRDYPLSKQRIRELRDWNEQRIERFRETMRKKKEARLDKTYKKQRKYIFPLGKRELFLGGLFLYWGEGSKTRTSDISISNTDPSVIKFFIAWTTKCLKIPQKDLRVQLHLYGDMDIKKELRFWSRALEIPLSQFRKPYIKKTLNSDINHKGGFGHGTCNVKVGNTGIAEDVLMGIRAISERYNKTHIKRV